MRFVAALPLAIFSVLLLPAAAAAGPAGHDGFERAIVRAVNDQRAEHGLGRMTPSRKLARAADYHSRDMIRGDFFAHTSRNGDAFERRVRRYAPYRAVGETLAWVARCSRGGARTVVRMWMGSPGHRAVLLSGKYRRIGVGKRSGSLGGQRACMVTADFGSRR